MAEPTLDNRGNNPPTKVNRQCYRHARRLPPGQQCESRNQPAGKPSRFSETGRCSSRIRGPDRLDVAVAARKDECPHPLYMVCSDAHYVRRLQAFDARSVRRTPNRWRPAQDGRDQVSKPAARILSISSRDRTGSRSPLSRRQEWLRRSRNDGGSGTTRRSRARCRHRRGMRPWRWVGGLPCNAL